MLNKNEEIEKVAQQLYKKYKSAFDLVFKYTTSTDSNDISNKIQNLIANEKSVRPFQGNKSYIRFQPNYFYENLQLLKNNGLVSEQDDFSNNWMFIFEFNFRNNQVTFDCKIGQGEQDKREKLYQLYKKHNDIFTKVVKANRLSDYVLKLNFKILTK